MKGYIKQALLAIWLTIWVGCQGQIGQPGGDGLRVGPSDPSPLVFECDPDKEPTVTHLRRLSRQQYSNTLDSLVATFFGGFHRDEMRAEIEVEIESIPDDVLNDYDPEVIRGAAFKRLNDSVSQAHVNSFVKVGAAFAEYALSNLDRRSSVVGVCSVDADTSNDADCIEDFIERFGLLSMRRPLSDEEFAFYKEVYADGGDPVQLNPDGFRDVIAVMLASPNFLYHVAAEGESLDGRDDLFTLGPYALASRLSYHFWETMPDAALFSAAADGSILTDEGYRAQVERVFHDGRTDETLDSFFYEWLNLEGTPDPSALVGTTRYDVFAGDDIPTPALRQNMIDEVLEMTRHYRRAPGGTLDDIFVSEHSFAQTEDLAKIYGVQPWDGSDDGLVSFTDPERSGVLTRAALVSTGTVTTRPIIKGVLIRRNMLCDSMPNPPANRPDDEVLSPPYTKRQETESLTEQPGSSCLTCHSTINDLGFATETFDALGRVRYSEPFIMSDGSIMAELNLDTSGVPEITPNDNTSVQNGAELSEALVGSGKVHACFARHYFRYTFGRAENLSDDGCVLESIRQKVIEGGSLEDTFKSVAFEPAFKLRRRGKD